MLMILLTTQRALLTGTPAQQRVCKNRGIPWNATAMAEAIGSKSVSTTLSNLEERLMVFCLAEGEGRGRRVSHVKLSHEAIAAAQHWEQYRQSEEQRQRWRRKMMKGWEDLDSWLQEEIYEQMKLEDSTRVSRYSNRNNYLLDALNSVLDDK